MGIGLVLSLFPALTCTRTLLRLLMGYSSLRRSSYPCPSPSFPPGLLMSDPSTAVAAPAPRFRISESAVKAGWPPVSLCCSVWWVWRSGSPNRGTAETQLGLAGGTQVEVNAAAQARTAPG